MHINILKSIREVCFIFIVIDNLHLLVQITLGFIWTVFQTEQTLWILLKECIEMLFLHLAFKLITIVVCLKDNLISRWDGQFLLIAINFFYLFTTSIGIEKFFDQEFLLASCILHVGQALKMRNFRYDVVVREGGSLGSIFLKEEKHTERMSYQNDL